MKSWFLPSPTSLVSPFLDVFLAGGLSVILFIVFWFLPAASLDMGTWSLALYYASFAVNFPHFAASYQLLYGDAGRSFVNFKEHPKFAAKLWWAGLVVPIALIAYFGWAVSSGSVTLMGYLVNALFFFVGWHYVKQIFGVVIMLSAAQKVYYATWERLFILVPLYSLWALSYISFNLAAASQVFYHIPFTSLSFPVLSRDIALWLLVVGTPGLLWMLLAKWQRERKFPPFSALVAIISIYLWYVPSLYQPFFFYIVPLLHSLQYLLFVVAYRRNVALRATLPDPAERSGPAETLTMVGGLLFVLIPAGLIGWILTSQPIMTIEQLFARWASEPWMSPTVLFLSALACVVAGAIYWIRQQYSQSPLGRFVAFFLATYLLGFLFFAFIPHLLDLLALRGLLPQGLAYSTQVFGASLYFFFFTIFLNIHHYFIDNVIWKRDNPALRGQLFLQPEEVAVARQRI